MKKFLFWIMIKLAICALAFTQAPGVAHGKNSPGTSQMVISQ